MGGFSFFLGLLHLSVLVFVQGIKEHTGLVVSLAPFLLRK